MYDTITVEKLSSSIGAVVHGLDLSEGLAPGQAEEIKQALLDHLVIFIQGQNIDDEQHEKLATVFGDVFPHPIDAFLGEQVPPGHDIGKGAYIPGEDHYFHTDYSFLPAAPSVAVLRGLIAPDSGGDTIWASMYDAYDTLSQAMRDFIENLTARHDQGTSFERVMIEHYGEEVGTAVAKEFPGAEHPLVIAHPETGHRALYVNEAYARSIVQLTSSESKALLGLLFEHINNPRFHCRYRWSVGDIAIWDERSTLHLGEGRYWPQDRLVRRIVVGTHRPVAASAFHGAPSPVSA
jgi:taurine dioxygenase